VTRPRAGVLSPAQQGLALRSKFPAATCNIAPGRLAWTGAIQPTPVSRTYTLRVIYTTGGHPSVLVLRPTLDSRPGEALPHVFRDGSLCLYQDDEWQPSMFIADSILPWASEWLAHYELWKATGHWCGDREPPAPPD
jgi:hypothetical protein